MKKLVILFILVAFQFSSFTQDSLPPHLKGKMKYPVFNLHKYMAVVDTDNTVLKYDDSIDY